MQQILSRTVFSLTVACAVSIVFSQPLQTSSRPGTAAPLKVFISVDMEGLAGVVTGNEVSGNGPDYAHFRTIMAGETNAAIEGAARAGATEFLVRDSHGAKQNLLPGDVDPRARLLRGASTGPKNMMEGIDASFHAAIFIGYHARAGTPNAILAHTSNGNVIDFSINGVSMPEAGYNALVAGLDNVPVAFVAGDQAFVDQARELLGPVEAVAVKQAVASGGVNSLSPGEARRQIQTGVERALRRLGEFKPYKMNPPYTMVLKVRQEKPPYGDATRKTAGESRFVHNDLLEILNAFNAMK
jgi:D-amino peptidase